MVDNLTITRFELNNGTYFQVGEVLKQKSLKKIQQAVKENLSILIQQGQLQIILNEIKEMNLFEIEKERQKYHASSKTFQFSGLNQKISHYEINREANNLIEKLFKVEFLIDKLRSMLLGLPMVDFSLGVKDGDKYYYITSDMQVNPLDLLMRGSISETGPRFLGNRVTTQSKETAIEIRKAIEQIKQDAYFKNLSEHFSNMMQKIPELSNPHSNPGLPYASEVFEQHIQLRQEKNTELTNSIDWDHSWSPVADWWNSYHMKSKGYDKYGHKIGYSSATQGGDINQTQVKSFILNKNSASNINIINMNNLADIFSFWIDTLDQIQKNQKISNKIINEIITVLLPNDKLYELGFKTLGKIRGLKDLT